MRKIRFRKTSLVLRFSVAFVLAAAVGIVVKFHEKPAVFATTDNTPGYVFFRTGFEDSVDPVIINGEQGENGKGRKNITGNIASTINLEYIAPSSLRGNLTADILNNFSVDVVCAHQDGLSPSNETIENFFDGNKNTKFLGRVRPTPSNPIKINFELNTATVVRSYGAISANDDPGRDPKAWNLYGSNSAGGSWVLLDSQDNIPFDGRFAPAFYDINNSTAYRYYQLEITQNSNADMTQIGNIFLASQHNLTASGIAKSDLSLKREALEHDIFRPSYDKDGNRFYGTTAGFLGDKALKAEGVHIWNANDPVGVSRKVIYKNLNIPVTPDIELSYVVMPYAVKYNFGEYSASGASANGFVNRNEAYVWDLDYMATYLAVDLQFTDGTYLSDLNAVDQNQNRFGARAQGDSRTLIPFNWNHIFGKFGVVAAGKTIDKVLVVYDNPNNPKARHAGIAAYFDEIIIRNHNPADYTDGGHDGKIMKSNYVNILRTTNDGGDAYSRGATAPLIQVPHGFNSYIPASEWDSGKPYNWMDRHLYHIELSHYSSQWIGSYGTMQFMPQTSQTAASTNMGQESRIAYFDRNNEIAHAHYYSVTFNTGGNASGVKMEVAPQSHSVAVRFTFPANTENRNIIFDQIRGNGGQFMRTNAATFTGYSDHRSGGSKRMHYYGVFDTDSISGITNQRTGKMAFGPGGSGETVITMWMASSFISQAQAQKNLELEMGTGGARLTFDQVKQVAQDEWENRLRIIDVEGATEEQLITLYSCIYRMYSYPNLLSENTGTNEEPDWRYKSPYQADNTEPVSGKLYTNNGFWDTYRTTWPAYSLFTPNHSTELLNGLVAHYKDVGWVPRWIAPGGHNMMVGTNSDIVFADSMKKGIPFDYEGAYMSALRGAAVMPGEFNGINDGRREWRQNAQNGGREWLERGPYLGWTPQVQPMPGEWEVYQYSWAIEGYINDYAVGLMADYLSKDPDFANKRDFVSEAAYYSNRSLGYFNYFDTETQFLRSKNSQGQFENTAEEFNPYSWFGPYTEADAFNMTFTVPHDPRGLRNLYGGAEGLKSKLDELFTVRDLSETRIAGRLIHEIADSRDLRLGNYLHGNQPSHHIPFMYNYAGYPSQTQWLTRDLLQRCFIGSSIGQGYLGDEDNGEQSAWYVLSAVGLYPMSLGNNEYAITSPLYGKIILNLDNGKTIVIHAQNNSKDNVYIQSMKLNGQNYTQNTITHDDLKNGAVIDFVMGSSPSSWANGEEGTSTASPTQGDVYPDMQRDIVNHYIHGGDNINNYESARGTNGYRVLRYMGSTGQNDFGNNGSCYVQGYSPQDSFALFDNDAITNMRFTTNVANVYIFANSPVNVDTVTITGVTTGESPTRMRLFGSNDGTTWTLIKDTQLQFTWNNYLVPVDVRGGTMYEGYRLELSRTSGVMSVAEVELIGGITKNVLSQIVQEAERNIVANSPPEIITVLANAKIYLANLNGSIVDQTKAALQLADKMPILRSIIDKRGG